MIQFFVSHSLISACIAPQIGIIDIPIFDPALNDIPGMIDQIARVSGHAMAAHPILRQGSARPALPMLQIDDNLLVRRIIISEFPGKWHDPFIRREVVFFLEQLPQVLIGDDDAHDRIRQRQLPAARIFQGVRAQGEDGQHEENQHGSLPEFFKNMQLEQEENGEEIEVAVARKGENRGDQDMGRYQQAGDVVPWAWPALVKERKTANGKHGQGDGDRRHLGQRGDHPQTHRLLVEKKKDEKIDGENPNMGPRKEPRERKTKNQGGNKIDQDVKNVQGGPIPLKDLEDQRRDEGL